MSAPRSDRDDPLSREIDAALDGVDLQNIDQPARRTAAQRAVDGTQRGAVVGISGKDVFVELGPRMQGVLPL